MKKLLLSLILITVSVFLFAQTPNQFKYQAVLRNTDGTIMAEENVTIVISILKSDLTTNVFNETHNITTTSQGLINLNIGSVEDLGSVNWTSDEYFIEISMNGNVIGTNQLLSVPYALHAKTAENLTRAISETDPVFSASEASNITATDITNLSNLSGSNTGDQDISDIATNTQAIQDTASQIRTDITIVKTYSVGDFAQGGIVFWVDETGQHGLVAAKKDQDGGSEIHWYNGSYTDTEAHGDGVYAGEMNTMLIIANQGSNSNDYAAGVCANYTVTESGVTYGDWYLPSKEELNLMYQNKETIDATAEANGGSAFADYYWSSSETNNILAWLQYFADGSQANRKKDSLDRVRAVRAF